MHLYFRAPSVKVRSRTHVLGRGIDVVAAGLGVLAPPSARVEGAYAWRNPGGFPEILEFREIPSELLARIQSQGRARDITALVNRIPTALTSGERNTELTRYAGRMRWRLGFTEIEMQAALEGINAAICHPPLAKSEVTMIATSIANRPTEADPLLWLRDWRPHLSLLELRLASALADIAEYVAGPLTPAGPLVEERSGLDHGKYYITRKKLEERGAIRVRGRGRKLAPIIDLLPRQAA